MGGLRLQIDGLRPQTKAPWAPWAPWAQGLGQGTRAQGPGPGTRAQGPGPGTRAQGPGQGTRAQGLGVVLGHTVWDSAQKFGLKLVGGVPGVILTYVDSKS